MAVWGARCASCERSPARGPCDAGAYAARLRAIGNARPEPPTFA